MSKKHLGWVLLFLFSFAVSLQAQFNILHSFEDGTTDGQAPYGSLVLGGSVLYGMTTWGGTSNCGTIFKIKKDGSGYAVLHSFAGGDSDGADPYGSLIVIGSTLYGMTSGGGTSDYGTIFKIKTDGTGFTVLHSFTGGTSDGTVPLFGSLAKSGSTLYGMTRSGGTNDSGTVFKINTGGTGYALLHSFVGGASDGLWPSGSLIIRGSMLYGMTEEGGVSNLGTIFKIKKDGTQFALLHSFAGGLSDGFWPLESLIVKGSLLCGMTEYGGADNKGTIFKVKNDGTGFILLHSFTGGASDGQGPVGSLIVKGSLLYGMTSEGGVGTGTLFKIKTDGTGFTLLHSFTGGDSDGSHPYGSLILKGPVLYGMTFQGGTLDHGVVFACKSK